MIARTLNELRNLQVLVIRRRNERWVIGLALAGICVPKNRLEAIRWLELAYPDGGRAAGELLAELYLESKHASGQDVKRALEILRDNARNDYAPSQTTLGTLYAEGGIVKRDYQKARELWTKAARTDRTAKYNLAILYDKGDGIKRDSQTALVLAKEAERAGALTAKIGLCSAYVRGDAFGVTEDLRSAYPYCYEAASLEDAGSMNMLALIYLKTGEVGKALTWLRRSAEKENAEAQYSLGMILLRGLANVRPDPEEGKRHLQRSAAKGHERAREVILNLDAHSK